MYLQEVSPTVPSRLVFCLVFHMFHAYEDKMVEIKLLTSELTFYSLAATPRR